MATREASWCPALQLLLERPGTARRPTSPSPTRRPSATTAPSAGMHAVCTEVTGQIIGSPAAAAAARAVRGRGPRSSDERGDRRGLCRRAGRATGSTCRSPPCTWPGEAASCAGSPRRLRRRPPARASPGSTAAEVARRASAGWACRRPVGRSGHRAVVLPLAASAGRRAARRPRRRAPARTSRSDEEYRAFHELMAGAVRRRGRQRPRLRGRAAAGRVAGRARPREDDLLLRRQPRAADPADPAARPDQRRPRRRRRAAAGGRQRAAAPGPAQRPAAAAAGQRPARLRQHRGRAGAARCACETDVATFTAELAGVFRAAAERAGLRLDVDCPPLGRPGLRRPAHVGEGRRQPAGQRGEVHLRRRHRGAAARRRRTGSAHGRRHRHRHRRRGATAAVRAVPPGAGATARTREGTGIGLALVHELAGLHGGAVTVASEPGVGSTFTVALPFGGADAPRQARSAHPRTPPAARRRAGSGTPPGPGGPRRRDRGRRRPRRGRQRRHARLPDPAAGAGLDRAHDGRRRGGPRGGRGAPARRRR